MTGSWEDCPRIEALSALLDGELSRHDRDEIAAHAAVCPSCSPVLLQFSELSSELSALEGTCAGVDIAALIEPRLPKREQARPARPPRRARWQLAPMGVAAAGVLALGAYLGLLLGGGAVSVVGQPAAMAVFDAIPPGGLCVGLAACAAPGR